MLLVVIRINDMRPDVKTRQIRQTLQNCAYGTESRVVDRFASKVYGLYGLGIRKLCELLIHADEGVEYRE